MNHIIKEKTDDGSNTLFVPQLNEHYHSTKGALTESKHIFIQEGFLHLNKNEVKVLEVGFGTGLNAIETLFAANENGIKTSYHSLELFPLTWQDVCELGYTNSEYYSAIIEAQWNKTTKITDKFELTKHLFDFTRLKEFTSEKEFDVVYFDAFAPEKQPEMWNQQLFNQLYVLLKSGGVLTTYCAKGAVRRMLQSAGFEVERIPGPPGGKREILRANKK